MTLREELDALDRQIGDVLTERHYNAACGRAYRSGDLVPLPEVEEARLAALEEAAKEELKAATGTLAEAMKDLRACGMIDAAEVLERKTMPETVAIFAQAIRNHMKGKDQPHD